MPKLKLYNVVCAFLGWLGAVNSLFTGIFIATTVITLRPFPQTEQLILQGYIAGAATVFSSVALTYGSYLVWKGSIRKGGTINFMAGIIFTLTYLYFTLFSQPPLLKQFEPFGYFLMAPPLLSGAIGLLANKKLSPE